MALLLWGVHMVQSGMQRALGPRLRVLLAKALASRLKAFLAGIGVTAALQSSTATGLMVTGFTVEGLIELVPALAVMLGANVGTTLIVQLLSFDVALLAPPLVLAGVIMFRRSQAGIRDFGRVLIGLGLLLTALHQLVAFVEPLTESSFARDVIAHVSTNITFDVFIAAIIAWLAHSSVATVLLAMTLAAQGVVPLEAAFAFVIGANFGAALNPLMEGAATSNPATRRLPVGNLINRGTGVLLGLAALPWLAPALQSLDPSPARAVANFHVAFNIVLALLFLPLLPAQATLLRRLLPSRVDLEDAGIPVFLDPATRANPTAALAGASREVLRMVDVLEQMLIGLRETLCIGDRRQLDRLKRLDDVLDRLNTATKNYVLSLDTGTFSDADSQRIARILTFSISVEQAGDLVDRNLLSIADRRMKRGVCFSPEGEAELVRLVDRLIANTRLSTSVFLTADERLARELAGEKEIFRQIENRATAAHFQELRSGDLLAVESSSLHLDALRDLKRVNAHLVEAAAYPILKQSGELLRSRLRAVPAGPQAV